MLKLFIQKIKHPLFKNSLFLYISNFADFFLLIMILPYIARIFGPATIGEVGLSQSIGLIFLIILEYGFGVTATKKIASNENIKEDRLIIGQVFSYKLYLTPFVIILSLIISLLHPIFKTQPYLIYISTADAIFQSFIPSWYFKGKQKFRELAFIKISFRLLAFILILIFVKSPSDSSYFLALFALSSMLIALTQIILVIRKTGPISLFSWKKIKHILKPSTFNFFIIIMPTIFNNIGILILSLTVNPIITGYYYGVTKIHRAFNTLYSPIFETFFPYIIGIFKENKQVAIYKMKIYNFALLMLGLLFFLTIWFFSEQIILFVLGENFISAKNYLKAFSFLLPMTVFSYVWGNQWMIILNEEKKFSKITLVSNFVGVIIMLIYIPKLSIYAIPMAIAFSELIKIVSLAIIISYDK